MSTVKTPDHTTRRLNTKTRAPAVRARAYADDITMHVASEEVDEAVDAVTGAVGHTRDFAGDIKLVPNEAKSCRFSTSRDVRNALARAGLRPTHTGACLPCSLNAWPHRPLAGMHPRQLLHDRS